MSRLTETSESVAPLSVRARRVVFANLVAQTAIVVTGGLVRLTGSGLGCPTWPECVPGSYTPVPYQEEAWHKYVEFGNRLLTFVLVIIAIATFVVVWRHRPRRRALIILAAVPFLGTVAQAILGGITVITGLNPYTVSAHFLVSMALIAAAVVLWVRSGEAFDGDVVAIVRPPIRALSMALLAVVGAVIVVGTVVTGSGPHSGDAGELTRFTLDPRTVSWLHADLVLLFIGLGVGVAVALRATSAPATAIRYSTWLLAIAVAQGILGYVQFLTGLPWVVVLVHQLGSCLVWIMTWLLVLSTRERTARRP